MADTVIPPGLKEGATYDLFLKVSPEMVERFALLTGDCSSLHTNQAFGRRSMYRDNVVHGLIPVAFISLLDICFKHRGRCKFIKLSAQFIKPVFVNDELCLTVTVATVKTNEGLVECEYRIINRASTATVTTGRFSLNYTEVSMEEPAQKHDCPSSAKTGMLTECLPERDLRFEQISRGLEHSFDFSVTGDCVQTFFRITSMGLQGNHGVDCAQWMAHVNVTGVLAACLFSTFTGMCIPGKHAMLLDFRATIKNPIKLNKPYTLRGAVAFKSDSTGTLVETLTVLETDNPAEPCVSGKINTRVNESPITMPSIDDLKKQVTDRRLNGKVALITGASRGIGETTAKLLSLFGAKVVVNYFRGEEDAKRIVAEITSAGGEAVAIQADVSDRQQVKQMVEAACKHFKTVDILVNNAVRDARPIPLMELTWNDFQRDIDVTVKGAFNCCQEIIPLMQAGYGGKIINISTVFTESPPPHQAKYVVSKSALNGLTRCLAVELAPFDIQVNMVVPGMVKTDLSQHVPRAVLSGMGKAASTKHIVTPADVAIAVVLLASSSNSNTGQKIPVIGSPFH